MDRSIAGVVDKAMNFEYMKNWPSVLVGLGLGGLGFVLLHSFLSSRKQTSYKGKIVVITGASSGIGEALALQFASLGSNLVLAARRIDRLEALVHKCKTTNGVDAIAVQADVTKESDCQNLIDEALRKFGRIDVLLLNAGRGSGLLFNETNLQQCREIIEVNYYGYMYPTFFALPHLRKTKGTIIAISSLAALVPSPKRTTYSASKAAVNGFFRCLRTEEPDIQVTIINAGFVATEIFEKSQTPRKLSGDISKYMTAAEASQIIIKASSRGVGEVVMSTAGKVGYYLRPFFPDFVDRLASKVAGRAAINEDKSE